MPAGFYSILGAVHNAAYPSAFYHCSYIYALPDARIYVSCGKCFAGPRYCTMYTTFFNHIS